MKYSLKKENLVELKLPTKMGYEKVAMTVATTLAKNIGLPARRIDDLNTALSEAILNAMEHGNQMNHRLQVFVTFTQTVGKLIISIRDQGPGCPLAPDTRQPDIEQKITGDDSPRGWGWFLIEQLVDQVEITNEPGGGTTIRLIISLEGMVDSND